MTSRSEGRLVCGLTLAFAFALAIGCSAGGEDNTGTGGGSAGTTGVAGSGPAGTTGTAGTPGQGGSGPAGKGGSSSGVAGTTGVAGTSGEAGRGGSSADRGGTTGAAGEGTGGTIGNGGESGGRGGAGGSSAGTTGEAGRGGAAGTGTAGTGVAGASGGSSGRSSGCGKTPGIPSSMYNNGKPISITAANMQRRYVLNVPTNYDNNKPYKLIITWHHRDGNDRLIYDWQYYGLLPLSNNSAIFVAPNGQKNGSPCTTTASGDSSCGWPNPNDSDLALGDAVVAQIEENFCVDTNRIFAHGWSYGGSMSFRTACSRPLGGSAAWGVRAIAVYSGAQLSGNCTPSLPVAYYGSHGTHDSVLNYDSLGLPLPQAFAKANGCTWGNPTKVTSGAHVCTNLSGCKTGYPLEFCSFNGDHTPYPDNGQAQGSWGPQEAWKFLSQF